MTTTYPDKVFASLRDNRRFAAWTNAMEQGIEVGFKDERVSPLAEVHEFGLRGADGGVKLPERPAFRAALPTMNRLFEEHTQAWPDTPSLQDFEDLALMLRDHLRHSYRTFHGTPLSKRQRARKAGTPAADQELVGAEGERLIEHIGAWVGGVRVG